MMSYYQGARPGCGMSTQFLQKSHVTLQLILPSKSRHPRSQD